MSPQTIPSTVALEPRGSVTSRPRQTRTSPPPDAAFAAFLADRRLSSFDKLLLTILATYCLAPGNAWAWPQSSELARRTGVDQVRDGGEARVNRSLLKMERLGILERIAWHRLEDFLAETGGPRLGLDDPRIRAGDDARRFLLLWWKVPGLGDDFSIALRARSRPGAGRGVDKRVPGAVDCHHRAPSTAGHRAPSTALPIGSKLELLNGTEENVTEAPPPGETRTTTAEAVPESRPLPDPAEVRRWTEQLKSPRAFERTIALASLAEAGAVPPEWADKVPVFTPQAPPAPRPAPAPAVQLSPSELVESRVRRLADPSRPAPDDATIETLAEDVAAMLRDRHSRILHRHILAEVADGLTPLLDWISAFRKARQPGETDPGRRFGVVIKPCRRTGKPIVRAVERRAATHTGIAGVGTGGG